MKVFLVVTMIVYGSTTPTVQKQPTTGMNDCLVYEAPRVLEGIGRSLNIEYMKAECVKGGE